MNYKGTIIEESLENLEPLKRVAITSTRVEPITEHHKTPWLKQWTLHKIEVPQREIDDIANLISISLESEHSSWYVDFKNKRYHFIVYPNKVFKVDLKDPKLYKEAKNYGISLGIPEYQVDFASSKMKF